MELFNMHFGMMIRSFLLSYSAELQYQVVLYSLYVSKLSMCKCVSHIYLSEARVLTVYDEDPLRFIFSPALSGHNNHLETFMPFHGMIPVVRVFPAAFSSTV
jgi:hypothetical protein